MRLLALSPLLALSIPLSNAVKFPVKRLNVASNSLQRRSGHGSFAPSVFAASSDDDNTMQMTNYHDLLYLANITVGGIDYPVQLDTGSSDLWIKGPTSPLPNSNVTSQTYNLTYGIGWANGSIAYAPVEFAGIKIPSQAYLDVSSALNPALSYGADGIVGLGFTSLSTVDALVNRTGASTGRSLLFNAFADNPSEPNFIAFSMQRTSDPTDDAPGTFSIGEVEDGYVAVLNSTAIPTYPPNSPSRWNVLLEAVLIGTQTISVSSSIPGVPAGNAVALIDSGTSYTYATPDVCQAIYGNIPGAKYDSSLGQWIVPCDAEVDVALQIAGQIFPVHPLDVTPTSLTDPSTCVGSFVPQSVAVGENSFDWLIGDSVLRSVYTIYDFGDFDSSGKMGNPYIKMLALVDPNEGSRDFHQVRGGTASGNITYNAANVTNGGSTSVTISEDLANTLNKIGVYVPAMLAVMALNALVIILLLITAVVYMVRRRGKGNKMRRTPGRALTPMPPRSELYDMSSMGGGDSHVYQPVSMALTEDTFVPPSPAFSKPGFAGDMSGGMGARPKSVA
ncbi:acid protease [Panus rudis PR-1116 ss-1]|nr:acid protease [Panus rudis PR-1116 ss-1]